MSNQVINYNSVENYKPITKIIPKKEEPVEHFHLERVGDGVKMVSDGFVDENKEVQNEKVNAGLENIKRLQALRYGTLENAIVRARDKGVYADVSNIPTSIAEQQELINKTEADVVKLCKELGLTKEQLLQLTPEKYAEIKTAQAAAEKAKKDAEAAAAAAAAAKVSQPNNEGGSK